MIQLNKENIVTIGSETHSEATLYWFHGYGANNWSFEPSMKMLNLLLDDRLFIVIPNAPEENGKRSWYPLPNIGINQEIEEDFDGLRNAQHGVQKLIDSYKNQKKVFVGGFSQGAALALSYIFENMSKIDGCIALSGYMPNAKDYASKEIQQSEIFIAHGTEDLTIRFESFEQTKKFLLEKTKLITEYTGDFGHTITKSVTNEMTKWISNKL